MIKIKTDFKIIKKYGFSFYFHYLIYLMIRNDSKKRFRFSQISLYSFICHPIFIGNSFIRRKLYSDLFSDYFIDVPASYIANIFPILRMFKSWNSELNLPKYSIPKKYYTEIVESRCEENRYVMSLNSSLLSYVKTILSSEEVKIHSFEEFKSIFENNNNVARIFNKSNYDMDISFFDEEDLRWKINNKKYNDFDLDDLISDIEDVREKVSKFYHYKSQFC